MKKILLSCAMLLVLILPVLAETEIRAEVDKTSITTDELLTYKVVITSSEKELPKPKAPDFKGFVIVSQAQSSTSTFVKGGAKSILVLAFILAAKEKGRLRISPCTIKVKGKEYSSQPFEIEVKPGNDSLKPMDEPPLMPQLPDRTDEPRATL